MKKNIIFLKSPGKKTPSPLPTRCHNNRRWFSVFSQIPNQHQNGVSDGLTEEKTFTPERMWTGQDSLQILEPQPTWNVQHYGNRKTWQNYFLLIRTFFPFSPKVSTNINVKLQVLDFASTELTNQLFLQPAAAKYKISQ